MKWKEYFADIVVMAAMILIFGLLPDLNWEFAKDFETWLQSQVKVTDIFLSVPIMVLFAEHCKIEKK